MTRERLLFGARLAITILIIAVLLRTIGEREVVGELGHADVRWIALTYVASLSAMATMASLLRLLLRVASVDVRLSRIMLASALSTFYSLLLPSDVVAGLTKWIDLSAATGEKAKVLSAMILAKLGLAVSPLVIGSLAIAFDNPFDTLTVPLIALTVTVLVIGSAALLMSARARPMLMSIHQRARVWLPDTVRTGLTSASSAIDAIGSAGPRQLAMVLLHSVVAFALGVVAMACSAAAVGADIPVQVFLWVSMVLFITRLIPVTVGNLGIREGLFVAVFGLYGVAPATAFAIGLIMFSATLLIAAVGAAYQVAIVSGKYRWRGV